MTIVEPDRRAHARILRRRQTEPETVLWNALRNRQLESLKFRRQVPVGPYVVDFLCLDHRLIVELDGSQHGEDAAQVYDGARTAWLEGQGFRVVRFWNDDVLGDLDGVCSHIVGVAGGSD